MSQKCINKLGCTVKQICVFYIRGEKVWVFIIILCAWSKINFNITSGPDGQKVTWSAVWPTVLLSQFLYTNSHSTPSLYHSLHSWSCQQIYCDYTKTLDISLVLNALLNQLSSKCTVSLQMWVSVNLLRHYGNYAPFLQRKCIEICIVLCFWYSYWWGRMERDLLGNNA